MVKIHQISKHELPPLFLVATGKKTKVSEYSTSPFFSLALANSSSSCCIFLSSFFAVSWVVRIRFRASVTHLSFFSAYQFLGDTLVYFLHGILKHSRKHRPEFSKNPLSISLCLSQRVCGGLQSTIQVLLQTGREEGISITLISSQLQYFPKLDGRCHV